jgi:putative hydrolase of HD superfamily
MKEVINFLFEVGMLKKTPRTGYQFLGSGHESVADHSFRTAIIGYLISRQEPGADSHKTTLMCLFHDLHEARTGDHNYVNKRYVHVYEEKAIQDLARELPFGEDIISLTREFSEGESLESYSRVKGTTGFGQQICSGLVVLRRKKAPHGWGKEAGQRGHEYEILRLVV